IEVLHQLLQPGWRKPEIFAVRPPPPHGHDRLHAVMLHPEVPHELKDVRYSVHVRPCGHRADGDVHAFFLEQLEAAYGLVEGPFHAAHQVVRFGIVPVDAYLDVEVQCLEPPCRVAIDQGPDGRPAEVLEAKAPRVGGYFQEVLSQQRFAAAEHDPFHPKGRHLFERAPDDLRGKLVSAGLAAGTVTMTAP